MTVTVFTKPHCPQCNATKRQQFAAISVEFVHDNQVYRSMLSFICTSGAQEAP